jgi:hypothetical protein
MPEGRGITAVEQVRTFLGKRCLMGQMKKLATARQMGFATPQVAQRHSRVKATEPPLDQSRNTTKARPGGSEAIQGTLAFGAEDEALARSEEPT